MKFQDGQRVSFVCAPGITGIILGTYQSQSGFRYEVSYWSNGERHIDNFHEKELEEYKEVHSISFGRPDYKNIEREPEPTVYPVGDKIV